MLYDSNIVDEQKQPFGRHVFFFLSENRNNCNSLFLSLSHADGVSYLYLNPPFLFTNNRIFIYTTIHRIFSNKFYPLLFWPILSPITHILPYFLTISFSGEFRKCLQGGHIIYTFSKLIINYIKLILHINKIYILIQIHMYVDMMLTYLYNNAII